VDILNMRSRLRVLICLVPALAAPMAGFAQAANDVELQVKAAFVYQFTRYVEWPVTALTPGAPFSVCVVAQSRVRQAIEQVLAGERVEGRSIRLVVPATPEAARSCQLLYIEAKSMAEGETMLGAVHRSPVLTISDASEFVPNGGHIQLVRDGTRVRFDVNQTSARESGLTFRSQLLRVARGIRIPAADAP
jgi:hypothetical protein